MSRLCPRPTFTIPKRLENSMTGSQFASSVMNVPLGPARELAIFQQLCLGNVPDFMRASRLVTIEGGGQVVEVEVLPDVLCVGTDQDFVRVPMNPMTAQKVADRWGATLITPAISDLIWLQADVRIDPTQVTMPPTPQMTSTEWFFKQNEKIEKLRAGAAGLIAGHKKDVVLVNNLSMPLFKDKKVAIYGWHQRNGVPIQGVNPSPGEPLTHEITYADYSHGLRFAADIVTINGNSVPWESAVRDATVASILNKDGVLTYLRYPTA